MDNKLDMSFGSPDFLQDYWKNQLPIKAPSGSLMSYSMTPLDDLKEHIQLIHGQEKNADASDKHIVVGQGASQILIAILASFDKGLPYAWSHAPFYPRFPHLANFAGYCWIDLSLLNSSSNKGVQIITVPNNPTNSNLIKRDSDQIIFDLSYNWRQYENTRPMNEDIMVFSLAKATGHASSRIGWALLRDKEFAERVQHNIELMTNGISIEAQMNAVNILNNQLHAERTVFQYGEEILRNRWNEILDLKDFPFKILNDSGMFLWAQGKCPDQIKCIEGREFAVTNEFNDCFRLNIGCNSTIFEEFIKCLQMKN